MKRRYGFVMLVYRCIDCKACQVGCWAENEVPLGKSRNWITKDGPKGKFPELKTDFLPGNCMHCGNAPCVKVCPTGASYQTEEGTVLVNKKKCIGCKYCMVACPYNARYYHPEEKTADKCTMCVHRLKEGLQPACVSTCVGGARVFGDLNDPDSQVSRLLRKHRAVVQLPQANTQPNVYYVYDSPVDKGGIAP